MPKLLHIVAGPASGEKIIDIIIKRTNQRCRRLYLLKRFLGKTFTNIAPDLYIARVILCFLHIIKANAVDCYILLLWVIKT